MDNKLIKSHTLYRKNLFLWSYDGEEVFISKRNKSGKEYQFTFYNTEIDGLIEYIKEKDKLSLDNNVNRNTSLAKAASQLISILYNTGVLDYNNKEEGIEFVIENENWKDQLLKFIKKKQYSK